jgi:hypothetical protein
VDGGIENGCLTHEKICHAELFSVMKPDFALSMIQTSEEQLSRPPRSERPILTHDEVLYADIYTKSKDSIR